MALEKRQYPRICPTGVQADVYLTNHDRDEELHMQGCMLDMSYAGIRIKLTSAMPENLSDSDVQISLKLPNSDVTCTIKGHIRHISENTELGLQYANHHKERDMDQFMFECVRKVG